MASAWLRGGGEVGALMRGRDWSASPLGPPEGWPRPLRSAVALLLNSKFPMFVAWGPALGLLYNDAYAEILGAKHPASLGARLQDVWVEVWSDIRPLVEAAMGGEASYREDLPLLTNRHGYDEQAWFTFSYSPAPDDDGQVAGMFCAVVETTARVREEQRRAFLFELDERLRDLGDAGQILDLSAALLGEHLGVDRAHWAQVDVPQDRFEVGQEWTRPGVPGLRGAHRLSDFGAPLVAQMAAGGIVAVADTLANVLTSPERVSQAFGQTLRGALSVPLLRGGTWRAALCAHTVAPRLWREDERELVREAAERVWTRAERALAEARVRESEVRFRVLVNATSDVVYRASADWSELRQLDGRGLQGEPGRHRGAWIHAYVPADEQAFVKAAIAEAIRTRSVFELEHRVRHVDGTVGWIQ
ncbi:MAG: domain S-box, partial [Phenylobacterium sp.]|nr:domain S-box [Phenylobacterium sp.]